jgi:hypothetical protein
MTCRPIVVRAPSLDTSPYQDFTPSSVVPDASAGRAIAEIASRAWTGTYSTAQRGIAQGPRAGALRCSHILRGLDARRMADSLLSTRRPDGSRDPFCHKRGSVCRTLGTGWSLCLGRPEAGPERRCDEGWKGAVPNALQHDEHLPSARVELCESSRAPARGTGPGHRDAVSRAAGYRLGDRNENRRWIIHYRRSLLSG